MSETHIVDAAGRPISRGQEDPDRCPRCRAGREKRINTAGFGEPVICCRECGHHYAGATE